MRSCVANQHPQQHLTSSQLDCIRMINDQDLVGGKGYFTQSDQVDDVLAKSNELFDKSRNMDFLEFIFVPIFGVVGYFVGKHTLSGTVSIQHSEE